MPPAARQYLSPAKFPEAQKAVLPHADPEDPAEQPMSPWVADGPLALSLCVMSHLLVETRPHT